MRTSKNIQILFHRAQKHQAEQITSDLSATNYNFSLINASQTPSWADHISESQLIWFVSDNFFKSVTAMDRAINILRKRNPKTDLFLIVSPGLYPDNDLEMINEVPTKFQRMGDIIPYMNFWQTEYLDMRKWRRNLPEKEQLEFDVKLNKVKQISAKIADFLGIIKDSDYIQWMDLINADYQPFFKFLKDEESPQSLALNSKRELVDLINSSSEELIRENESEEEFIPVDLEEIPGMDLLSKASSAFSKTMEDQEIMDPWRSSLQAATNQILNGDIDTGLSEMDEIVSAYPEAVEPQFRLALSLLEHKDDAARAEKLLESIIKIDSSHIPAHFLLGEISEWRSDFDSAKKYYEFIYELDKKTPDLAYRLGMLYAVHYPTDPKYDKNILKQALKEFKARPDVHYQLGLFYQERLGKISKAKKHFLKTLKYQPEHPFANYDLALIDYQEGKFIEARGYYLNAVEANPELRTPENEEAFRIREAGAPSLSKKKKKSRQVVLITGATSGIGKACAQLFAKKGYNLILTGRRKDRLESLQKKLSSKSKGEQLILSFDVRDHEASQEAIKSLKGKWGKIDLLINNAGLAMGLAPVHTGDTAHWETMIDTNVKGLLYMTRIVSPGMVKRKKGMIINICSTAGKEVYPNGNVYCATKHAVDALTKSFRLDLYKHGIRVGQVSPAHVEETEFALVRFEGDTEKAKIYEDFQPLKSSDVANAIYFMATQPKHVNVQDILLMGSQQAGSTFIDRSGR